MNIRNTLVEARQVQAAFGTHSCAWGIGLERQMGMILLLFALRLIWQVVG